jgi:spermidine synthase
VIRILVILSVSVAPVTFISSFVFVRLSSARQNTSGFVPGSSFSIETAGSVAAGILTAITVTLHISNYQLYLLILLLSAVATIILLRYPSRLKRIVLISAVLLGVTILIFSPDVAIRSVLLRGVKAEKSIDTPYGNITTGTYGGEQTIFYDHRPLFFSGDIIRAEEDIHYALLQRDGYDKVMVISGGLKKHIGQLQKHSVNGVVYLEHDPGIIAAEGAHDTLAGRMNINVVKSDPIAFMRRNSDKFDAVLQLIPPPSTLSVNRFFTVEYFRKIKEHLSPGGLFLCTPMPVYNYSPESYCKAFSPVYNALNEVFGRVILVPGSSLYVIASDGPLSDSISVLAERRAIQNSYVNSDYLDDNETRRRSEQILSQVDKGAAINTAARPVSSWFTNMLSLESKGMNGGMIAVLILLIIIPFLFVRRGGLMMFASSTGLAGFGMIIIFILQMTVGNIYILSALVLTLLMAGLAAGAAWGRFPATRQVIVCSLLLAIVYGVTGFLAPSLVIASPGWVLPFIFIFLLTAGFLTGTIFRVLTSSGGQGMTGAVYASDLAGSALGYLTVSTILVPLAGISNVSFILAGLILLTGIFVSVVIKH